MIALVAATALLQAPEPDAVSLARRLDLRQKQLVGLTARFVQTYKSVALGREVVERGVVSVKRPGRMRWEYRDPEKKIFVSDGERFYFYVPADRQVVVSGQDGQRSLPALLLSGSGGLLDHFEVALEDAAPGLRRLRLVPRQPESEIEMAFLEVDEALRIRAVEVRDAQGNRSRFQFEDIREDVTLPDQLFRFEIPRGVEVITG